LRIEEDSASLAKLLAQYSNAAQQLMGNFANASLASLQGAGGPSFAQAAAGKSPSFTGNFQFNQTIGDVASKKDALAIAQAQTQTAITGMGALFMTK
jgi:hypothetical protein